MSTRTHLFWEAVLQLGECRSSRGVLRWPLGGGGSSWRRRSRRRRQGRGAAWRRRWSFGAQGYLTSSGVQLITVSLGWVPVASRRTGMTQGNPPWQFALRQGVTDRSSGSFCWAGTAGKPFEYDRLLVWLWDVLRTSAPTLQSGESKFKNPTCSQGFETHWRHHWRDSAKHSTTTRKYLLIHQQANDSWFCFV